MVKIKDLYSEKNIDSVLEKLRLYGIAVIKGYFTTDELNCLDQDYNSLFSDEQMEGKKKHKHPINEKGEMVRIKSKFIENTKYDNLYKLFHSEFMDKISQEYFKGYKYTLNQDIFLSHERASNKPLLPWHFDRVNALKFYTYLIDTDQNNGAFEYVPGSHREGYFRANYYIMQGVPLEKLPNDIPDDEIVNPITINAKKGDLLIFNPDGFHRGGFVSQGNERKVIRGHTHLDPMRAYGYNIDSEKYSQYQDITKDLIEYRLDNFGRAYNCELMSQAVTRSENKTI